MAERLPLSSQKRIKPLRGKSSAVGKRTGLARRTPKSGSHAGSGEETLDLPAQAKPAEPAAPLPGTLGPYKILEELGRGGMGRVLRGRDSGLKREVAVKILHREAAQDPPRRLRFIEEAQITGQLEHPGIVPVHFLGEDDGGREFFSMKLVEGRTLHDLVTAWHADDPKTREEFPLARLLSIFERVCETAGFAHSKGVIHRDLKPSNVIVGHHGEVWVIDWGLARVQGSPDLKGGKDKAVTSIRQDTGLGLTLAGHTVGTPEFMAPEQAAGEELDEGVDIFGLGAVLYAILTGVPPIRGTSIDERVSNAARGKFTPLRRTAGGRAVSARLAAVCEKCLAYRRDARYRSVNGLLRDLRAYQAGEAVGALPDRAIDKVRRFVRRHRQAVAVAGAVSGLVLTIVTAASLAVARKESQAREALDAAAADREKAQRAEGEKLAAERARLQAELEKEKALNAAAESARRRMKAFEPYARAMDLLLRGQRPDESARLLREALAIDPGFPEAQFALADALRFEGAPLEAAQAYLKADELSRRITGRPNLQAVVAAGFAYDGAGYYAQAEDAFLRAETHGAGDPLALVGKIFRLGFHRRLKEAQALAEQVRREAPHLWETHFAAGYVCREMVQDGMLKPQALRETAIPALQKARELAPRQAEVCVWLALQLAQDRATRGEAIALLDRAVELEPRNGNRRVQRAQILQTLGRQQDADAELEQAVRLKASPAVLAQQEVKRAAAQGEMERAFHLMGEMVSHAREWPPLVVNWLILGVNLNKLEFVRPYFARLKQKSPEYSYVYLVEAAIKAKEGDLPGAYAAVDRGLELGPHLAGLHRFRAMLKTGEEKYDDALAALGTALQLDPDDFGLHALRLDTLFKQGRHETVLDEIGRLEKSFPEQTRLFETWRKRIEQARKAAP